MKRIGNGIILLALLLACPAALGVVEATVDRNRVALGDTLSLTISATEDGEDIGSVDLSPLQQDFEILQRSTRSNTSIVNGQRSHSRQLLLEITPKRTGSLTIPALVAGQGTSRPLAIEVSEPVELDPGAEVVLFEAELDRESVYVQGQLILTLRLQQAVNLDSRSISELSLPGAFVVPLEQQSFQRTAGGRPWLVHEVRYAIFPEQSGTLEIPAQSFNARESQPRRSLFDRGGNGRLIRRSTPALRVEVLPRPADYPVGATWLPAGQLLLEEEWSSDPDRLQAGSSVTRNIRLRGEGLQGAQLPPVQMPPVEGLKYYPDQPNISDAEVSSGLLGTRLDSTAIVPTKAGTMELPEVRIPWWDTKTGQLRHAVLPARTIEVAAAQATAIAPTAPETAQVAAVTQGPTYTGQGTAALLWQVVAMVCALGWLATLYLLLKRGRPAVADNELTTAPSQRKAFKNLLAACGSDQATQARQWLIRWAAAMAQEPGLKSLAEVSTLFKDKDLELQLAALEESLYGRKQSSWQGRELAESVQRLRREWQDNGASDTELPPLYPAAN